MQFVLHRGIPEDKNLRNQWNSLVREMECPEVFYTYEWAKAVDCSLRESMTPLLLLAYEENSLVGVAALATDLSQRKTFFLASTTADYCDFVSSPLRRPELVESVFAELRKLEISMLVLANVPASSSTVRALASGHKHGYAMFSRTAFFCAQIELGSPGQKEAIKRTVQRKQMLRRHLKAMAKIAPVKLDHRITWERIAEVLPGFTKAHVARFLSSGKTSFLARPERQVFLAELAKLLSESGWVNVTCLMVGDQQVAWNYGFQFAGSWFWYQPTFDDRYQRNYPGLCLLAKIVEEACDDPAINRVDLGLGEENYKEWLATGGKQTLYITATTSRIKCAREILRYYAATAIKKAPWLEKCIRMVLRSLSTLRK